ncbi:NSUN6-like protein [Mya arenaria]|uniref:NSUN6-like protein n=1 Tax=Mya arenaria TaxID=6604 RepID=A0ABY7D938_MYAAR|nr:NSUN6-like protein [Mya arenaria]
MNGSEHIDTGVVKKLRQMCHLTTIKIKEVEDEDGVGSKIFDRLLKCLGTPPTVTTLRVNTLAADKHVVAKQLKSELEKQYNDRDLQAGETVAVYADLEGQCRKGLKEEYRERKIYVGCGVMQLSRDQMFCSAQAPSLDDVLPELLFAQNLPSIVCCMVLDPQPGETVIDMCASPGGKTNHIATLMNNEGRVVALDKTAMKVEKVTNNLARWNLTCVDAYTFDSTKCSDENADISGTPPYPPGSFDRVLLDVPCSALGQRPSARNRMTLKSLQSYSTYQRRFIEAGVKLLKPGGTLVYSTCTITMEENEHQVAWMLDKYPDLQLDEQHPHLGDTGRPCKGLTATQLSLLQRYDPTSDTSQSKYFTDNDTIGFFIAKFVKKKEMDS